MKKIISVLLSFMIMMIAVTSVAEAYSADNIPVTTNELNELLNSFRAALKNGDEYLSLKKYNLYNDARRTAYYNLYDLLVYNTNDIGSFKFGRYNESYITIDLITESDYITGVSITYDKKYIDDSGKLNSDLLNEDKKLISERYRNALSVAKSNMSDLEKALALYDHLITITDYPESIGTHGSESYPDDSYTAYGLLRDGFSTCLSYAKLYAILLNESGVPAVTVGSDTINHEWVMVCIDGEWYHCDPTWDDFLTDYGITTYFEPNDDNYDAGAVSHEYFLKSDEEFIELEHPDWEVSYTVNPDRMFEAPKSGPSGKFDDKFFAYDNEDFLCFTAINCINGNWYFCDIESNSVICTRMDGEPEYISLPDENEYIRYSFPYGNDLYVSTDCSVYRMDTVSDRFEKIFALPPASENEDNSYTTYSEMSIVYDKLSLTTASYIYNEVDENEDADSFFSNVQLSTETYPMNEVQKMKPVADTSEEILSAGRESSGENKASEPRLSEYSEIFSDDVPQPVRPADDANAAQIRSSSLIYMIIGAVVLCIAAATVIAALIINKRR